MPEFSSAAQAARIQGTVFLQVIIDEQGLPRDISVVSPLGYGLDEEAIRAVSKWRFSPGTKAGTPVKILASVEVNFRREGGRFDEKKEEQRTMFNVALKSLNRPEAVKPELLDQQVQSVIGLSKQGYPPAMHVVGRWKLKGEHVPPDAAEGFALIQKAARENYGPAIYDVAIRRIKGQDMPLDPELGMKEMEQAATLGSRQAQFYLAELYQKGDGVPPDLDRARRYYRLCAATGVGICEYRLGRLLYDATSRHERDYLQAVALFQLAAEQNIDGAREAASAEGSKLTDEQSKWVGKLKQQIVQKQ